MPTNPQSPAFPAPMGTANQGVTLRQYYAAIALQGLVAHGMEIRSDRILTDEDKEDIFAGRAFRLADALLRVEASESTAPA